MADRVNLDIGTDDAIRRVQSLRHELEQTTAEAHRLASSLGTAPSSQGAAQFFSAAQRVSGIQNQLNAITNSTGTSPNIQMQKIGQDAMAGIVDVMAGLPMSARAGMYLSGFLQQGVIPSVAPSPVVPGLRGIGGPMAYGSPAALGGLQIGAPQVPALPGAINNPANPFAGAGAMGPASAIGMPGYQANAYAMQQAVAMRQFYGLSGIAASAYVGGAMNYLGGVDRAGGADPQGGWGMLGTGIGMAVGFGVGALTKNPALGLGVGSAATALFGGLGSWFGANQANAMDAQSSFYTMQRELGIIPRGLPSQAMEARAGEAATGLNLPPGLRTNPAIFSRGVGAISQSLIQGGIDPVANGYKTYSGNSAAAGFFEAVFNSGQGFGLGNKLIGAAGMAISGLQARGTETVAEMYTRRLSMIYGKNLEQGMQQVGPVIASTPETGGNAADILSRFGPNAAYRWAQIQNEGLESFIGLGDLMRTSSNMRGLDRLASIGSLQARGSGLASFRALNAEASEIAGLPGGTDSLVYAQTRARSRDALMSAIGQADTVNFGIPMAQAQGRLARMNVLPFNPGNVMGETLGIGRMANRRAQVVEAQRESLRATGNLTEEAELQMTEQVEHYRTMGAQAINTVSQGFLNRLPALSAGRPGFFGRANSFQVAAGAVAGTPIMAFGALNGRQMRSQDDFYAGVGGAPAAWSRTQQFNNAGMTETNALLKELISAVKSNGGGSMRSGEAAGAVASAIYGKRAGNDTGGVN